MNECNPDRLRYQFPAGSEADRPPVLIGVPEQISQLLDLPVDPLELPGFGAWLEKVKSFHSHLDTLESYLNRLGCDRHHPTRPDMSARQVLVDQINSTLDHFFWFFDSRFNGRTVMVDQTDDRQAVMVDQTDHRVRALKSGVKHYAQLNRLVGYRQLYEKLIQSIPGGQPDPGVASRWSGAVKMVSRRLADHRPDDRSRFDQLVLEADMDDYLDLLHLNASIGATSNEFYRALTELAAGYWSIGVIKELTDINFTTIIGASEVAGRILAADSSPSTFNKRRLWQENIRAWAWTHLSRVYNQYRQTVASIPATGNSRL